MPVYRRDPLVRVGLEKLRADDLLDREDKAVLTPDTE